MAAKAIRVRCPDCKEAVTIPRDGPHVSCCCAGSSWYIVDAEVIYD